MRKILISILIVLLLVVGYLVMFRGLNVLGMEILSFTQIKDKNADLEQKLLSLSTLTSVDQPKAMSDLEESAKQLMIAKEEYNDKVLYSSREDIAEATITRPYETEYLWTRLGNHAKKNSINLKYELRQATSGASGLYDIYFTVTGSYVSISEFTASLENDSSLNFEIENFKLAPNAGSTENLQATFNVKEINVKLENSIGQDNSIESLQNETTTD